MGGFLGTAALPVLVFAPKKRTRGKLIWHQSRASSFHFFLVEVRRETSKNVGEGNFISLNLKKLVSSMNFIRFYCLLWFNCFYYS